MNGKDDAAIAAFIRARGVTRVAEGEGALNHLSAREKAALARAPRPTTVDPAHERHIAAYDHLGRAVIVNGLGEWVATE